MEKIKLVISELDVAEILLSVVGDCCLDDTVVQTKYLDYGQEDILIIQDRQEFIDKIYGRKFKDGYYFARYECVDTRYPEIDYYDEFFSDNATTLGGY